MSHDPMQRNSAVGLDVGTSRICLAKRVDDNFHFETQLNAFVTIPASKITENVLAKERVPHSVRGSDIVVHGNESDRFADLLNVETRRTMDKGLLNPAEPDSLDMLRKITESLLGPGKERQKLCFTVPAAPIGSEENLTYHEATLHQLFADLGYEVKSINEGLAVVYSELESTNFTGIGISCGGGMCNVCLAYLSVPVISFSVPKGGDYIDSSSAAAIRDLATSVRVEKEKGFRFNGFFENKVYHALSVYYDDVIQSLVKSMRDAFTNAAHLPKLKQPVPLVLSGGTAIPPGFQERFEKTLRASDFPIELSEIRTAADPLHSTAKGTLVATLCES